MAAKVPVRYIESILETLIGTLQCPCLLQGPLARINQLHSHFQLAHPEVKVRNQQYQ